MENLKNIQPIEDFNWDALEKGDSYGEVSKDDLVKTYDETLNTVKDKQHRKLVKYYESLAEDRYTYTGATDIVLTAVAKALALDMSALCDSKYIASDLL